MTKYVVIINELNQNAEESVSFEEAFDSIEDAVKYVSHFNYHQHCNGYVEKRTKEQACKHFMSEVIMRF